MLQIDVWGKWLTRIKGTKEHKIRLPAVATMKGRIKHAAF